MNRVIDVVFATAAAMVLGTMAVVLFVSMSVLFLLGWMWYINDIIKRRYFSKA